MGIRIAFLTVVAVSLFLPAPIAAAAGELPPVRITAQNTVPDCATPGRLMSFLRSRNPDLDPRFETIAVEYMRHGEALGMRWDYAFFQMVIETGYLTFKRDHNKPGLVRPSQNNFAGLGATGGERGESFRDVSTGVLAHLQHLLLYAGHPVPNPVAERTRKVMEWGILDSWQKTIEGPITFAQLARRWASSGRYAHAIQAHADRFYESFCDKPDPQPELIAMARPNGAAGAKSKVEAVADAKAADQPQQSKPTPAVSGLELARQAIEQGKAEGNERRSALGGASLAAAVNAAKPESNTTAESGTSYTVLNPTKREAGREPGAADKSASTEKSASTQTASIVGGVAKQALAPPAKAPKCRVWTASYGGQKAMLIRAQAGDAVNYTVLDVNEGAEKREAEAYIAAYAKGGTIAGEFPSPATALDKAFELCPEG